MKCFVVFGKKAPVASCDEDAGIMALMRNMALMTVVVCCSLFAGAAADGTNAVEETSVVVNDLNILDAAKIAAEKGGAAAQFRYAEMLRDGLGVAKSMKDAANWTRKAADAGYAPAQCQMGLFYMNGLGVDRDEDKAEEWLKKAAAQNHLQAQYNLGIYYARFSDGESVRLAIKWLNEAAKQDYADAQFNLAKLYLNPHHPASREHDAGRRVISLLRLAAAQGHAGAKAKLKELGIAVPQSSANVDELRQRENATFINNAY